MLRRLAILGVFVTASVGSRMIHAQDPIIQGLEEQATINQLLNAEALTKLCGSEEDKAKLAELKKQLVNAVAAEQAARKKYEDYRNALAAKMKKYYEDLIDQGKADGIFKNPLTKEMLTQEWLFEQLKRLIGALATGNLEGQDIRARGGLSVAEIRALRTLALLWVDADVRVAELKQQIKELEDKLNDCSNEPQVSVDSVMQTP